MYLFIYLSKRGARDEAFSAVAAASKAYRLTGTTSGTS
jgi:hypothetical protein